MRVIKYFEQNTTILKHHHVSQEFLIKIYEVVEISEMYRMYHILPFVKCFDHFLNVSHLLVDFLEVILWSTYWT